MNDETKKPNKSEKFESDYISNLLRRLVDLEIKLNIFNERISNVESHLSLAFEEIDNMKPIAKEQNPTEVEKGIKYIETNENETKN